MADEMTGSGTAIDPYVIYDVTDLQDINDPSYGYYGIYYELANDIDASVTELWNGGDGFMPIGEDNWVENFVFDGKGHTIENLFIHRSAIDTGGYLGFISGGWADATLPNCLKNFTLKNFSIRQKDADTKRIYSAGILSGGMFYANCENVEITDSYLEVDGRAGLNRIGAVFGEYYVDEFCHDVNSSNTTVKITGSPAEDMGFWAGAIGSMHDDSGEIWRCYAHVTIINEPYAEANYFGGFCSRWAWGSDTDYPYLHDCFVRGTLYNNGYHPWRQSAFISLRGDGRIKNVYSAIDITTHSSWMKLLVTTSEMGELSIPLEYTHTTYDDKDGLHPERELFDSDSVSPQYTNWDDCHDAVGFSYFDEGSSEWTLRASRIIGYTPDRFIIHRGAIFFDTSSLIGLTILSAKLTFMIESWGEDDAGGATLHLVEGTQSCPVVDSDYQALRDSVVSFGSLDWIADYSDDPHPVELPLNALGLAHINQTGLTKFGIRLGRDLADLDPTGGNWCTFCANWENYILLGENVENSFFDKDLFRYINIPDWYYGDPQYYPYPKTTAEMKTESTFTSKGWDFDETWFISEGINDGYPFFKPFFDTGDFYWW